MSHNKSKNKEVNDEVTSLNKDSAKKRQLSKDTNINSKQTLSNELESNKKRKVSTRPWRGYTAIEEGKERKFGSVGCEYYYIKQDEECSSGSVTTTTATTKLLQLHHKFILHRISLDEVTTELNKSESENIHKGIPHSELQQDCKCIHKNVGTHHNIFPDMLNHRPCVPDSNNAKHLFHYRMMVTPDINFVTRDPTTIYYDGKDFCFEGYSLFTHVPIDHIPDYSFIRNSMDHKVQFIKEPYIPEGFCIYDTDLICDYLFTDVFELLDWKHNETVTGKCRQFHFMPRFVHKIEDFTSDEMEGQTSEILSVAEVFDYIIEAYKPFTTVEQTANFETEDWKDFSKESRGCLVLNPQKKPRVLRVDAVLTPKTPAESKNPYFEHTATMMRSAAKEYTKEFNELMDQLQKVKRTLRTREAPRRQNQETLLKLQNKINQMKLLREQNKFHDIKINSEGYMHTGLRWDICQHASYLPGVWKYIKFMLCLTTLEKKLTHQFKNISLLRTALTHSSYNDQSTVSTHVITMLQNMGKCHPHVERNQRPASLGLKKKGVLSMTNIMATLFTEQENVTEYLNNERLEFLGDAVLDYLTSLHLFFVFSEKGPGKLTEFRSSLVQRENLARIAKKLELERYILINHNTYKANEGEKLEMFLADAVEAIIGAMYLDCGLAATNRLLSSLLFPDEDELVGVWTNLKSHPLQTDLPDGDRHLIEQSSTLKSLVELEEKTGIQFKHIRLLCTAMTHHCAGLDNQTLTNGTYQRLEFLGDAILKYICSDYLYKRFPAHSEGHLTLLRTSFVNMNCLIGAAKEIDLDKYIIYQSKREAATMNEKVVCDVFEAFIGAIHVDKGIKHCRKLIEVCILSKLREFVINQDWLDSKSQLQQCCHSIQSTAKSDVCEKKHSTPVYKLLRQSTEGGVQFFKVAVYFKEKRLGTGFGRSLKLAEKEAARMALRNNHFEQYAQQKKIAYLNFGAKPSNFVSEDQSKQTHKSATPPRHRRDSAKHSSVTPHRHRSRSSEKDRRDRHKEYYRNEREHRASDSSYSSGHKSKTKDGSKTSRYHYPADNENSNSDRFRQSSPRTVCARSKNSLRSNEKDNTRVQDKKRNEDSKRENKESKQTLEGRRNQDRNDNREKKENPTQIRSLSVEFTSDKNDGCVGITDSSDEPKLDDCFFVTDNYVESDEGAVTLSSGTASDVENDGGLYDNVFDASGNATLKDVNKK